MGDPPSMLGRKKPQIDEIHARENNVSVELAFKRTYAVTRQTVWRTFNPQHQRIGVTFGQVKRAVRVPAPGIQNKRPGDGLATVIDLLKQHARGVADRFHKFGRCI